MGFDGFPGIFLVCMMLGRPATMSRSAIDNDDKCRHCKPVLPGRDAC